MCGVLRGDAGEPTDQSSNLKCALKIKRFLMSLKSKSDGSKRYEDDEREAFSFSMILAGSIPQETAKEKSPTTPKEVKIER